MGVINDRLALLITANADQAIREVNKLGTQAERDLGRATSSVDKFANTSLKLGAAAVGFSAVLGAGLLKTAQAASEAQVANAKLDNTLANSAALAGSSRKAYTDLAIQIQGYAAVTDEAVIATEATLGQFGLTEHQILQLTPLVVDLSRKMGVDLESATKAVGKAVEGNAGALQRLGVIVTRNVDGTVSYTNVLDTLRSKVGGFAAAEGQTFEGQLTRLRNSLRDVAEGIGSGVIPAVEGLIGPVASAANAFKSLDPGVQAGIGRIATIGTVTIGAIGALGVIAGSVAKLSRTFHDGEGALNNWGRAATTLGRVGFAVTGGLTALEIILNRTADAAKRMASDIIASAGSDTQAQIDALTAKQQDLKKEFDGVPHVGFVWLTNGAAHAKTAYDELGKQIDALNARLTGQAKDMQTVGAAADDMAGSLDKASSAFKAVQDAEKAVADAHDAVAKKARDEADATDAARKANDDLTTAQEALTKAQRDAPQNLARAHSDAAKAVDAEASAVDAVTVAIEKYGARSKQAKEAQDALTAARLDTTDAAQKAADLDAAGNRPPDVVAAEQQIADAKKAQADAAEAKRKADEEDPVKELLDAETNRVITQLKLVSTLEDFNDQFNTTITIADVLNGKADALLQTLATAEAKQSAIRQAQDAADAAAAAQDAANRAAVVQGVTGIPGVGPPDAPPSSSSGFVPKGSTTPSASPINVVVYATTNASAADIADSVSRSVASVARSRAS